MRQEQYTHQAFFFIFFPAGSGRVEETQERHGEAEENGQGYLFF